MLICLEIIFVIEINLIFINICFYLLQLKGGSFSFDIPAEKILNKIENRVKESKGYFLNYNICQL